MKTADFDYALPESLIADKPLKDRSASRLLVLHRDGILEHRHFFDLPLYLCQGDILIINNTKVFPARLTGATKDGKTMEFLLVKERGSGVWDILSKGKFTGTLAISDELEADVHEGTSVSFRCSGDLSSLIWKYGNMPLPPYIRRPPDRSDKDGYQTVYAMREGSIAAPTAGLHFTKPLLDSIALKGVKIKEITLHVGAGTFRPIRAELVKDHSMDGECFEIGTSVISEVMEAKAAGRRIIAVGTTTTRCLEGYFSGAFTGLPQMPSRPAADKGDLPDKSGTGGLHTIAATTSVFICPGYVFKAIDSLITNFHLPCSTPLMLVCALAGKEKILKAYSDAIANGYRFLSYGDAMLIL